MAHTKDRLHPPLRPAPRTAGRVLGEIVTARGPGGRLRRKLTANRERNWLLGLSLHAFSRLAAGVPLTDLETTVVRAFQKVGFNEFELMEHGQLYDQLSGDDRAAIFAGPIARLTRATDYALKDLARDLPLLEAAILRKPNVVDLDVPAIHAGAAHLRDFPMPAPAVLRDHAASLLRAVEPNVGPPRFPCLVRATRFRCNHETGAGWSGTDAPYWVTGLIGSRTSVSACTHVFGGVEPGEWRSFDSTEGWIWGGAGGGEELPDGEIGVLVSLWRHEGNGVSGSRGAAAAPFTAAGAILEALGAATRVAAVTAGAAGLMQWLIGLQDDDHIADQVFVFTRQVLETQIRKDGDRFGFARRFADGDGDYTLHVAVSRPQEPGAV